MIFTNCPYCNEPQTLGWEPGDGGGFGFFPSRCSKCKEVMWVEAVSVGGFTLSCEDFKRQIMEIGDEEKIRIATKEAKFLSIAKRG